MRSDQTFRDTIQKHKNRLTIASNIMESQSTGSQILKHIKEIQRDKEAVIKKDTSIV